MFDKIIIQLFITTSSLMLAVSVFEFGSFNKCENDEKFCKIDLKTTSNNSSYFHLLNVLKEHYDDIPDCRRDQCHASVAVIQNRSFEWPSLLLGERYLHRCRFHYARDKIIYFPGQDKPADETYYMYRDCILSRLNDVELEIYLTNPNDSACPMPPLSEQVSVISISKKLNNNRTTCDLTLEHIDAIYRLIDDDEDDEGQLFDRDILQNDFNFFVQLTLDEGIWCLVEKFQMGLNSDEMAKKFFDLLNAITQLHDEYYWRTYKAFIERIVDMQDFIVMFNDFKTLTNQHLTEEIDNYSPSSLYLLPGSTVKKQEFQWNSSRMMADFDNLLHTSRYILGSKLKNYTNYLPGRNLIVSEIITKDVEMNRHFVKHSEESVEVLARWKQTRSDVVTRIISMTFFKSNESRYFAADTMHYKLISPLVYVHVENLDSKHKMNPSDLVVQIGFNRAHPTNLTMQCGHHSYVRKDIGLVALQHLSYLKCLEDNYTDCSKSTVGFVKMHNINWLLKNGTSNEEGGNVFCSSHQNGLFGVFVPREPIMLLVEPVWDGIGKKSSRTKDTVSSYFNFPEVPHLKTASVAIKVISIVCLLLTVINFIFIKKAHKGTPTRILLNLCIALILFHFIFIIAGYRDLVGTECRIFNVLRYYMAFVTLLWNGVEAHHMFSTIVKVFNSHVRHFARKAAVVTWGSPFALIAATLTVDAKAFDGYYESCTFRCGLKFRTMVFAWLTPMIFIVLHNVIIFALICKCLANLSPVDSETSKKSLVSRLIGAVTLLVLLGVPWLLNAFVVFNFKTKESENLLKVFAIIFEVFICLQGLFIFLYHCMRNKHIRRGWSSVFSRSEGSGSSSSSFSKKTNLTANQS